MKTNKYPPLEIAKTIPFAHAVRMMLLLGNICANQIQHHCMIDRNYTFKQFTDDLQTLELDELLYIMYNPPELAEDGVTILYNGPHKILASVLHTDMSESFKQSDAEYDITKSKVEKTIIKDVVIQKWSEYKQIYLFDNNFVNALHTTEQMNVYPSLLRRLPYDVFYIEFKQDSKFSERHGVFTHVTVKDDNDIIVELIPVKPDEYKVPNTSMRIHLNHEDLKYDNSVAYYEHNYGMCYTDTNKDCDDNINSLAMFCMQAIMYLCSKEPDIQENPQSKLTYRKPTQIRNKYSEIRKWDVGVRYGNTLRLHKDKTNTPTNSTNIGSSKRPHTRRAHWHHYWTGKGRTQLELRWIEPMFIGTPTDIIATKHDVA